MTSGSSKPTRVALLGSTGSIGRQALDVLTTLGPRFEVVAMAAGRDRDRFSQQVAAVRPRVVSLADRAALDRLEVPPGTRIERSPDPLLAFATRDDVDLVLVATGGVVSLRPVLAALETGKVVATANKDTLVAGGHLVMPLATRLAQKRAAPPAEGRAEPPAEGRVEPRARALTDGPSSRDPYASPLAWLRPIDSEHSAIWQCLVGEEMRDVERLILTASGGPFRDLSADRLRAVTAKDALAHPTWRMGAKNTIDSATLMNKGLEVVEAHWLYDVDYDRIAVAVHPQSIVHSLVEFVDGSLKAQLGHPDMRIPIQYALTYPRRASSSAPRLDLVDAPALAFERPDEQRFPLLRIARDAAHVGPRATATVVSADDVAVGRFLDGTLHFAGIADLVAGAVERFGGRSGEEPPDLDELIALDGEVRAWCAAASDTGAAS